MRYYLNHCWQTLKRYKHSIATCLFTRINIFVRNFIASLSSQDKNNILFYLVQLVFNSNREFMFTNSLESNIYIFLMYQEKNHFYRLKMENHFLSAILYFFPYFGMVIQILMNTFNHRTNSKTLQIKMTVITRLKYA